MAIYTTNNKIWKLDNKWVNKSDPVDPYNPLGLPPNTIRCKFSSGYTPRMGNTRTLVDSTNNVWDIYKSSNNWEDLFNNNGNLLEILGANTSNVTNMDYMFFYCTELTSIPLFDTRNVTTMAGMFYNCRKVESGALALYQQASSQTNPPTNHNGTFYNCGIDTVTGAAELEQIPWGWKDV
jgi:surface protein